MNRKEIKRLSNGSSMTRFTFKTNYCNEHFLTLNSDIEAYICVLWRKEEQGGNFKMSISLLDEYGVNLKNISCSSKTRYCNHMPRIIATCEQTSHVILMIV